MFTAHQKGEILFLEMNSLKSTVNVMTRESARILHQILDSSCSSEIKLIILWSRKPYSFLNGAELLLTNHINGVEDLKKLSEMTRLVYERVAALSIPTVAAIEGNCFGCGMEFSLCCDYRVASDSYDTYFYMTELADYHCLPVFGGLNRLPRLVGLKPSVDLLLGGEKWWAEKAKSFGLVDEVLRAERFSEDLGEYFCELLRQGPSKRKLPKVADLAAPEVDNLDSYCRQVSAQIELLPPLRQPLYRQCLQILLSSLSENGDQGCRQESTQCSQMLDATSKVAGAFFFVRNMAKVASLGTTSTIPDEHVVLKLNSQLDFPFRKILTERKLQGLEISIVTESEAAEHPTCDVPLYLYDAKQKKSHPIRVLWGMQKELPADGTTLLYFPMMDQSLLCEVFISKEMLPTFRSFLMLLPHLGWEVIVVDDAGDRPRVSPGNHMIETLSMYVSYYLSMGGRVEDLDHTLWLFGFEWSLREMVQRFEEGTVPSWIGKPSNGRDDPRFLDGLFSTLYREGLDLVREGLLKHNSQVDLIMRLGLGYPLVREHFMQLMRKKANAAPIEATSARKESISVAP